MRPANSFHRHLDHHEQRIVNDPRPSPLKISKESHLIHKTSSSVGSVKAPVAGAATQQQRRHPVIIYTHSPKVIHARPRDFMALVQRLTGNSSRSLKNKDTRRASAHQQLEQQDEAMVDSTSKSISRPAGNEGNNETSSVLSLTIDQNGRANFADIPLFIHPSQNMGSSVSPSVLEFMKGLPEY